MIRTLFTTMLGMTMLAGGSPAEARHRPPPPRPAYPIATVAPVPTAPTWFRGIKADPAVPVLAQMLRDAPAEGVGAGPQLASEVETAARLTLSGRADDIASANRIVSQAFVAYVQAIKSPTPGMIYAYPGMKPQNTDSDQILRAAAQASNLTRHIEQLAALNPIYAALRAEAVKRLHASNGIPDEALAANLIRARSLPASGRFVLVNSAMQRLWMIEDGKPVDSMKVVVGMPDLSTPLIASYIHYATFNPYWNVPDHLVRKTIARNTVAQGLKYLALRHYEVMSDWSDAATVLPASGVDWKSVAAGKSMVRVRERPGGENSMGQLKFTFPNGQGIFMHDTPEKELMAKPVRTYSNGCIRLEDARRLGRWLLGREAVAPNANPEQLVQLPAGVAVYVTYLTTMPLDGKLVEVPDVYGWNHSPAPQVAAAAFLPVGARD